MKLRVRDVNKQADICEQTTTTASSNGESISPSTSSVPGANNSSTTTTTTTTMKLNNGHIIGALRQVSVQIERLKDIESLSPSSSPVRRSESPMKRTLLKKADSAPSGKIQAEKIPSLIRQRSETPEYPTQITVKKPSKPPGSNPRRSLKFAKSDESGSEDTDTKSGNTDITCGVNKEVHKKKKEKLFGANKNDITQSQISVCESLKGEKKTISTRKRTRVTGKLQGKVSECSARSNDHQTENDDDSLLNINKKGNHAVVGDDSKQLVPVKLDEQAQLEEKEPENCLLSNNDTEKENEEKCLELTAKNNLLVSSNETSSVFGLPSAGVDLKSKLCGEIDTKLCEEKCSNTVGLLDLDKDIKIKSGSSSNEVVSVMSQNNMQELTDTDSFKNIDQSLTKSTVQNSSEDQGNDEFMEENISNIAETEQSPSIECINKGTGNELDCGTISQVSVTSESLELNSSSGLVNSLQDVNGGVRPTVATVKRRRRVKRYTQIKSGKRVKLQDKSISSLPFTGMITDNASKNSGIQTPQLVKSELEFKVDSFDVMGIVPKKKIKIDGKKKGSTTKATSIKLKLKRKNGNYLKEQEDLTGGISKAVTPKQTGSGAGQGHRSNPRSADGGNSQKTGSNDGNEKNQDGHENSQPPASMGNDDNNENSGRKGAGNEKRKEPKIQDLKPCKVLVHKYVIRPAPVPSPPEYVKMSDGENHKLNQAGWMAVFRYLSHKELVQCLNVCKTWYRWVMDHKLWSKIDLNNTRIKQTHLIGIVKRQPLTLNLSYTNISFRQLEWLIARLPHLKHLDMTGNSWAAVSALCSSCCPLIKTLDMSWVSGVYDQCIRDLLSPPIDHRPGVDDTTSRFHNCISLTLTGCDVTDKSLATVRHNLPKIESLVLRCCTKLTDTAIETVADISTLKQLDISKCRGLTSLAFKHLKNMSNLKKVNVLACSQISETDIVKFAEDMHGKYIHRTGVVVINKAAIQIPEKKIKLESEFTVL